MISLATRTLVVDWVFLVLGLVGLILHFQQRLAPKSGVGWDDGFLIPTCAIAIAIVIQTTWAISRELQAHHQNEIPRGLWAGLAMSLMVHEALWSAASTFMRLSAALTLGRIFSPCRWLKGALPVFVFVCSCHGIVSVIEIFLVCRPLSANWDPTVTGHCGNQLLIYTLMESIGLILDVVILSFPFPPILQMKMPASKKVYPLIVLELGLILTIVSALRLKELRLAISSDFTYSQSYLGMLSALAVLLALSTLAVSPVCNVVRRKRAKSKETRLTSVRAVHQDVWSHSRNENMSSAVADPDHDIEQLRIDDKILSADLSNHERDDPPPPYTKFPTNLSTP